MANFLPHTEWTAMPHSKMKIANTEGEDARGEPPVNHRFQRAVARRAGGRPRGAWFRRESGDAQSFPELLFREDWSDPADHDLCQRYLTRKAPRLLMLHGLSTEGRIARRRPPRHTCSRSTTISRSIRRWSIRPA